MEILTFENKEDWEAARRGKLTGSKVSGLTESGPLKETLMAALTEAGIEFKKTAKKTELEALLTPELKEKVWSTIPEKITYYEILSERLAVRPESEHPMVRGNRLEAEAMHRLADDLGVELNTDLVIWQDEKIPAMAISPDAFVDPKKKGGKITIAGEGKCLASARHLEVFLTKKIPADYIEQIKWYFILNKNLETLYMAFYDPRMVIHDFFYLTINRSDFEEGDLESLEELMIQKLEKIDRQFVELTKGTDLEF